MILADELKSICPNTQLTKIEEIDNSVTTDIMLPNTISDVLEEVSEFTEHESLHVSNKHHDICSNDEIDDDENLLRLQEDTTTVTCHLLLKTKN